MGLLDGGYALDTDEEHVLVTHAYQVPGPLRGGGSQDGMDREKAVQDVPAGLVLGVFPSLVGCLACHLCKISETGRAASLPVEGNCSIRRWVRLAWSSSARTGMRFLITCPQ